MRVATISPRTPAPPPDGQWGADQMIAPSTPSVTAGKSRFRVARERCDLTQQELADRCELSLKTIKRYDAGGRPRSIEIAQLLAEVLDHPLDWLWPPDDHLNVRVARANHPAPAPPAPASIPDPHEVLATLRQTRPRARQRHARWLAPAIALATVAAVATIVVLATTGHQRPAETQTRAASRGDIARTLTLAPPSLLAARAVETKTSSHRASTRRPKQRSHRASSHHHPQKRAVGSGGGSSPAVAARSEQPTSTAQQPVVPSATTNAIRTVSSPAATRQASTRVASPQPAASEFGFGR
jgi:transcriptional regulator with XRE-family HTH domain